MDEELRDRRELSPAVVGLLIVEKDVVQQLLAKVQVLVSNCSMYSVDCYQGLLSAPSAAYLLVSLFDKKETEK